MKQTMDSLKAAFESSDKEVISAARERVIGLAVEGNPEAMYALATWYLFGVQDCDTDYVKAEDLLRKSASLNHIPAIYDLGQLIEKSSKQENSSEAFCLYVVAAIAGDADAMQEVVRCLYWGVGIKKDRYASKVLASVLDKRRKNLKE